MSSSSSTSIGTKIIIGLVLMAASNAVAWHMVSKSTTSSSASSTSPASLSDLRSAVWKIALFYTLWALYNKYLGGRPQDLGHGSFGLLLLSCLVTARFGSNSNGSSLITRIPLMLSCGLVVLNYAVVVPMILKAGGPNAFAGRVWKVRGGDDPRIALWGYGFSAYIASSVVLWCYCCYLFYTLPLEANGSAYGYGSLATDTNTDNHTIPIVEEVETFDV
jgi:hypothetical protein